MEPCAQQSSPVPGDIGVFWRLTQRVIEQAHAQALLVQAVCCPSDRWRREASKLHSKLLMNT